MADHNDLGKQGEEIAVGYLRGQGYLIRESNWFFGQNEIDIIAEKDHLLVIVEVKTRRSANFGEPECFVTRKKQRSIIKAADAYLCQHDIPFETRFDIISILVHGKKHHIHHIIDAFYATL